MAPSEPAGPSVSAHSGAARRARRPRARSPPRPRVDRALGEDRLARRSRRIVSHQLGDLARRRLRDGRARRDHRADDAQPVAARVVAERVVRRHERALGARAPGDAARDRAVEPREARACRPPRRRAVGGRAGRDRRASSASRSAATARDRVARVLPPVRVVAVERDARRPASTTGASAPAASIASPSHSSRSPPERTTRSAPASALTSSRAQLVLVRVGVRGEQPGDAHALAADGAREVGGLRRRGDDVEPVRCRRPPPRPQAASRQQRAARRAISGDAGIERARLTANHSRLQLFALRSPRGDGHARARPRLGRARAPRARPHRPSRRRRARAGARAARAPALLPERAGDPRPAARRRRPHAGPGERLPRARGAHLAAARAPRSTSTATACFEPADPSGEHHHHAICERCGKRDAFADPGAGAADRRRRRARSATRSAGTTSCCAGSCPDCA